MKEYIGLPWKIDSLNCWSFFQKVQRERFGRETLDIPFKSYEHIGVMREFKNSPERLKWVETNEPKDGDAVLMSENKRPHHVGVWINNGVLHCVEKVGVIFTNLQQLRRMRWNVLGYYTWTNSHL